MPQTILTFLAVDKGRKFYIILLYTVKLSVCMARYRLGHAVSTIMQYTEDLQMLIYSLPYMFISQPSHSCIFITVLHYYTFNQCAT